MRTLSSLWKSIKFHYLKNFASPKRFSEFLYEMKFGKKINWRSPEDLNQWINRLAFYSNTSNWPILADKYKVREYVKEKGYEDTLVPLLAVWKKDEQLSFDNLPNEFVLKTNNGSGDVKIIKNKQEEDIREIQAYFNDILEHKFGKTTAEPHYLKIEPFVMAETVLDYNKQSIKSSSLIDYKFWCFNGKPICCFICSNRNKEYFTIDLYTADDKWQRIEDGNLNYDRHHLKASTPMPKPTKLKEMLEMVSELSKGLPQVRVDLYQVDEKVYFGEMTLTSFAGRMEYFSDDLLKKLGAYCKQAVQEISNKS